MDVKLTRLPKNPGNRVSEEQGVDLEQRGFYAHWEHVSFPRSSSIRVGRATK